MKKLIAGSILGGALAMSALGIGPVSSLIGSAVSSPTVAEAHASPVEDMIHWCDAEACYVYVPSAGVTCPTHHNYWQRYLDHCYPSPPPPR